MSLAGVAVLGPIEAWAADGRRVELGTPRQKALLAVRRRSSLSRTTRGSRSVWITPST